MNEQLRLGLQICVLALAVLVAWLATNSPSFSLDNKAVYQGF